MKVIFNNLQVARDPSPDYETLLIKAPKIEVIMDLNWHCSKLMNRKAFLKNLCLNKDDQ